MKIGGWYVEGFGVYGQHKTDGLPDGLTIFLGPNEAGKTTLLAFLRRVLFGFPGGKQEPQYLPLRGGRHGGRVFLETPDGTFNIERFAKDRGGPRIILPDGRDGSEANLHHLLGGMDESLYRSVFAFSLGELHSFDTLTADGIRDRIFSAGISGAGRSAREVIAKLEQRGTVLYRPRGQSWIKELVSKLEELEERVVEAKRAALRYPELVQGEEDSRKQLAMLTDRDKSLRHEQKRRSTLIECWPDWHEMEQARGELCGLEVIDRFPSDPEDSLTTVLTEYQGACRRLDELEAEQRIKEQQRGELEGKLADALAEVFDDVKLQYRALELHRDRLEKLPGARLRRKRAEDDLSIRIKHLGPDWDESRLATFDVSIPQTEEVRTWEAGLRSVEEGRKDAQKTYEDAAREEQRAKRIRDRLKGSGQAGPPADHTARDTKRKKAGQLRTKLHSLLAMEGLVNAQEGLSEERSRDPIATGLDVEGEPARWLPPAFSLVSAALLVAATWRGLARDLAGALTLAVCALIMALAAYTLRGLVKRAEAGGKAGGHPVRSQASGGRSPQSSQGELKGRIGILNAEIAREAIALGLESPLSSEMLDDYLADLSRQDDALERARATLRDAESALEDARGCAEGHAARLREKRDIEVELRRRWGDWKDGMGLPASLTPQGVMDFFEEIQEDRGLIRIREEAQARVTLLKAQIAQWERKTHALLQAAHPPPAVDASGEALIVLLEDLLRRCQADRDLRRKRDALDEEIHRHGAKTEAARREVARREEARDRLFAQAAAADEAEYRERLQVFRRRQALARTIREREDRIVARIGRGSDAEDLRRSLSGGQVEVWKDEIDAINDQLAEVQGARDHAIGRLQDAERARQDLEVSADLPRLEIEREGIRQGIRDAVREWRTTTLARSLIEETLGDFTRNRQPAVLAEASGLFANVTDGFHTRLVQRDDGQSLHVEDRVGRVRSPEELSRGTAEQLYICLRLGLATEFAHRSRCHLPLVMDDVLVNFDRERAGAMARILVDYSLKRQILLFTCHESTVGLFRGISPATNVVSLDRHGGMDGASPPAAASWDGGGDGGESDGISSPTGPDQAASLILDVLRSAAHPLGKGEILSAIDIADAAWNRAIAKLREEGLVTQTGSRRGAIYSLGTTGA